MALSSSYSALLTRLYRWWWLGRIDSHTPEIPPGSLILAAHYNGAVDGFVYGSRLPPFLAVISVQWHRSLIGRWLLPGIAVKRAKDRGSAAGNLAAFREMSLRLRAGERLLFFPEGTSRLGRERLPIGRGTLLLLRSLRAGGLRPRVFFVAAHYHDPTRWRSNASLGWVGPTDLPEANDGDETWIRENLLRAQAVAYAAPVPRSYRWTWLGALLALPYLPFWAATSALARRTADDENVIALWKFIFGVPVTFVALAGYVFLTGWLNLPLWIAPVSLAGGWLLWNR
jgi:1-acyl-sn-glycerol-3-phosphate acyltransferase